MEPVTLTTPLAREARSDESPLLRLPLELRSQIYKEALAKSRYPNPEDVYSNVLCAVWKDMPSPLLAVNRQVRDEVCKILREGPVTLRVTGQDIKFDSLGLSCFIAHQRCTFTGNIRRLYVQVWPPHPERPVETYYIWKNLRRLRDDLRACKQIRRLDIVFIENELYSWSQDGVPGNWLSNSDPTDKRSFDSDLQHILDLFLRLSNTSKARILLPASVLGRKENEELIEHAEAVEYAMMNEELDSLDGRLADCLEEVRLLAEGFLKYKTAILAEKKLNDITEFGRFPMSQADYLDFVKVWPHFETLRYLNLGYLFKGCSFYAAIHGPEKAHQDEKVRWRPTRHQKEAWDMWLGIKGLDELDLESCC